MRVDYIWASSTGITKWQVDHFEHVILKKPANSKSLNWTDHNLVVCDLTRKGEDAGVVEAESGVQMENVDVQVRTEQEATDRTSEEPVKTSPVVEAILDPTNQAAEKNGTDQNLAVCDLTRKGEAAGGGVEPKREDQMEDVDGSRTSEQEATDRTPEQPRAFERRDSQSAGTFPSETGPRLNNTPSARNRIPRRAEAPDAFAAVDPANQVRCLKLPYKTPQLYLLVIMENRI